MQSDTKDNVGVAPQLQMRSLKVEMEMGSIFTALSADLGGRSTAFSNGNFEGRSEDGFHPITCRVSAWALGMMTWSGHGIRR